MDAAFADLSARPAASQYEHGQAFQQQTSGTPPHAG
jgi:hypothetical protein